MLAIGLISVWFDVIQQQLSVLSEVVALFVTQKREKKRDFLKFSNFANSWSWELKFLQDWDLVLKRTNPGSFFGPTNFGTNFHRWFGKPEKILVRLHGLR